MSAYSHPAAAYMQELQRQYKRRLWRDRCVMLVLNLALIVPMFTDWLK